MANVEPNTVSDFTFSYRTLGHPVKKIAQLRHSFFVSALTRRIIAFNFIALLVLLLGMLYLSQFRNSAIENRTDVLKNETILYAELLQQSINAQEHTSVSKTFLSSIVKNLPHVERLEVRVYDADATFLAGISPRSENDDPYPSLTRDDITLLHSGKISHSFAAELKDHIKAGQPYESFQSVKVAENILAAGQSLTVKDKVVGFVVVLIPEDVLNTLRKKERNTILRFFALATCISVMLSFMLAHTITSPLNSLATAMTMKTLAGLRESDHSHAYLPDMKDRDDEIGHLSTAMHNMTSALYNRIETNEQFAADVTHEIKNPLASLRSAVETLKHSKDVNHKTALLDLMEHDIQRLNRLVTDISNASRLDAELVKEKELPFDLIQMLARIVDYHAFEAQSNGIEIIFDTPDHKIFIHGLEERMAQVFVNLITNALSFCEAGDVVRVWIRNLRDRVLIVVEDTGEGIPEESLTKIFKRFYSNRPKGSFGNNSGLGLSISKQIVEAHGGVIWAENIFSKDAKAHPNPVGARFIVGLSK